MHNAGNNAEGRSDELVNRHHDVLSVNIRPQHSLLSHLHNMVDPLSTLFPEETLPSHAILSNVMVEPADPMPMPPQEELPKSEILGQECRLSESYLWKMQEDYYSQMGPDAWRHNVPNFVTSSVYMAESYAEMILAFLEDYYGSLQLDEPVYIVEMATGVGRFSYLVMRELEKKLRHFSTYQNLKLKYVMTDFTDANPSFWEKHSQFKPFVDKGLLDFAVFNPLVDTSLQLRMSGQMVSAETVKNPIIAISNYFFDSIKQDIFRVEAKRLLEGLVTLERNMEGLEPEAPLHISQITTTYRYQELRHDNYYPEAKLNEVLRYYKHNIKDGTIIFPIGAFEVVRNLERMSNQKLVLLSSDKAYSCHDHMTCFYTHSFAVHDGAFSYMVNYDALGRYFQNMGGYYFCTEGKNLSLQTVCLSTIQRSENAWERMSYLFEERINRTHTATSLCTLLPDDRLSSETFQLDQMIAQLRIHMSEPKIVGLLTERIVPLLQRATYGQQQDLVCLLEAAYENYYQCPGEANLPFWLSNLYYALERYEESLGFIDLAIRDFGEHEALYFLKAQAYEKLSQWALAQAMYEQSLAISPDFDESRVALQGLMQRQRR